MCAVSASTWAHALSEAKGSLFVLAVWAATSHEGDQHWRIKAAAATMLYLAAHIGARVMRAKSGEELP